MGRYHGPATPKMGKPKRFRLSVRHRMMVDTLTKQQRSETMSRIRGRDTKPEWVLRCGLHRLGFRYRLDNRHLPGRPDLVFPKYRAAVFVHGCYWHRHPGCKDAGMPGTNVDFWKRKFDENVARDRRKQQQLEDSGWRVMVVWECELVGQTVSTIQQVASWLTNESNASYSGVNRRQLLAVAERKVRYRIAQYKDQPATGTPAASEAVPRCKRNDSP